MKTQFWVSLGLALAAVLVIAIFVPGDPKQKAVNALIYGGLIVIFLFGFLVIAAIVSGDIPISRLLEEKGSPGGGASMSRFQFLIFTFVIAISLLLIVVCKNAFPDPIPAGVLTLLGISASTYAVSKGIQVGASNGNTNGGAPAPPGGVTHTTVVAPPEAGGTVTHTTVVSPQTSA